MLTKEIKTSIDECVLCWLATVDSDGNPNCSPKEGFAYSDSQNIVIADIASPQSRKNILSNPTVCVSFVHVFKQKGFKLKGVATYLNPGENGYSDLFSFIEPILGNIFPVRGLIRIFVKHVETIIAPGYYMVPGTTEESQVESAKKTYGV